MGLSKNTININEWQMSPKRNELKLIDFVIFIIS